MIWGKLAAHTFNKLLFWETAEEAWKKQSDAAEEKPGQPAGQVASWLQSQNNNWIPNAENEMIDHSTDEHWCVGDCWDLLKLPPCLGNTHIWTLAPVRRSPERPVTGHAHPGLTRDDGGVGGWREWCSDTQWWEGQHKTWNLIMAAAKDKQTRGTYSSRFYGEEEHLQNQICIRIRRFLQLDLWGVFFFNPTTTGEALCNKTISSDLSSVSSLLTSTSLPTSLPTLSSHAGEFGVNPLLLSSDLCGICSSVTARDSSARANIHPQCKLLY